MIRREGSLQKGFRNFTVKLFGSNFSITSRKYSKEWAQGKDQLTYVGIFKSIKFEHRYPARFANLSTALRFFWYSLKRAMIQHLFCANARMMFLKPETGRLDNKISAPPSEWSQTITFLLLHVLYIVSCGSVVEHLGWWSHSHGLEFGYIFESLL